MRSVSIGIIAGLVLLLAALAVPAMAFNTPIEITAPGTYTLSADVINSGSTAFVVVKADDVVIKGAGHILDGRDVSTSKAIVVERYIKNNVWYTPTNVEIRNIVLRDWGIGISAYLGEITVVNAEFRSNKQGILFKTVHEGTVSDSTFANNYEGIKSIFGNYLDFEDNTFTGNNWGAYIDQSNYVDFDTCTFTSNGYGIRTSQSTEIEVEDGKFTKNTYGVFLDSTVGGLVEANTFTANKYGAYLLGGTTKIAFTQNTFKDATGVAVYIDTGVAGNRFWDNLFNNWHNVFFASGVGPNAWISPLSEAYAQPEYGAGPNIIGKMVIGGNFWAQPDMMGWSQITYDVADVYGNVGSDDIADWPFEMAPHNVDDFPLHK